MSLDNELKTLIIECLDLEDISADEIETDAPLFGEGLGLDSIDALELGLAISKKYDVKIDAENEETKTHFASVANLAKFIQSQQSS